MRYTFSEHELDPIDVDDAEDMVDCLAREIEEDEATPQLISPKRMEQMELAYRVCLRLAEKTGCGVSYELNAPYTSMGYISMEGERITITPAALAVLYKLSGNIDTYATKSGTVRFDITFHGIAFKF